MKKLCIIEFYKVYFQEKEDLVKLLEAEGYEVQKYAFFDKPSKSFHSKTEHLLQEFLCIVKIIFHVFSFRGKKILCMGGHWALFLNNRLFGFLYGKDYHLYVYNFYLHAMGEKKVVKQILKFLLHSSRITLIVQSPKEVSYFKSLSDKCVTTFIPYCSDFNADIPDYSEGQDYIFTGGYTNRDYPLIIKCAGQNPSCRFVIVASTLNAAKFPGNIPPNVTLYYDMNHMQFYSMVKNALAVIVPLEQDVGASGQMLCLGAMALGKPVIYTDVSSINYYFQYSHSGIPYTIGDPESLNAALKKMLALSKDELKTLGENAKNDYNCHFTKKTRDKKLVEIMTT